MSRQRYFPGVGHLVMRDGWSPESTWIEFDCGSYFAEHQHLDQNQITIYHRGYLAIDSGADYTDTESPHYLNYYRRTVAHNESVLLVYDPAEKFFWSDNLLPAANDGGQRMDSSRYWNTIRSPEDCESYPRFVGPRLPCTSSIMFPVSITTRWEMPATRIPAKNSGVSRAKSSTCRSTASYLFLIV